MSRPSPRRTTRSRKPRGESAVGRIVEVDVGPVAHGGHCVARLPSGDHGVTGRVIFVRHAITGERVRVVITEGSAGDSFWRGDAIEVFDAAPDRVDPACPVAGPGLCGGCDFQHVSLPGQRRLKADVVREQLIRVGGFADTDPLVRDLEVEAVPVRDRVDDGLRWRTRTRFVATEDGRRGLRRHRSHDVVPVEDCLITTESALAGAARGVDARSPGAPGVHEQVLAGGFTHQFARAADGFWQVHPEAPRVLVETVLDLLDPQAGESVLDLYGGVGLFAAFLRDRVGPPARIALVEGDREAAQHARENLGPATSVRHGDVGVVLAHDLDEPVDLVVLDPPRAGAKRAVVEAIMRRRPRAVAYVACDPAALARDLSIFGEAGYRLQKIRAFDLFPMTHHVECVALIEPMIS